MSTTYRMTLVASVVAASAGGALASIQGNPMTITATSSMGTASYVVHLGDGQYNPETGDFTYSRSSPITLMDDSSGRVIATLNTLSCSIVGDPQINIGFSAVAGNATTLFTISSGLNVFAPIANPTVSGVASMTITDAFGSNTAVEHGNVSGPFAYGAMYNGGLFHATLINDMSTTPDNTANQTQFLGGSIAGMVSNMSAQYSFTLTPNDSVSGTSVYTVAPTPAGLALIGVGGLVLGRRRR